MNIQPLINAIRYKLRYGITVEWYNFWYMALRCHQKITPQVASIDETIRIIIEDQCSAKHADSGELTSFCMAVGGTACCCPTGYTTIHSSPVPTWTSLPKKTAHGGFTR